MVSLASQLQFPVSFTITLFQKREFHWILREREQKRGASEEEEEGATVRFTRHSTSGS